MQKYITPWSNAKEGNKFNTGIGQDCSFCPPGDNGHHQYKIEEGCFVDGVPSCRWCAYTDETELQALERLDQYLEGDSEIEEL